MNKDKIAKQVDKEMYELCYILEAFNLTENEIGSIFYSNDYNEAILYIKLCHKLEKELEDRIMKDCEKLIKKGLESQGIKYNG